MKPNFEFCTLNNIVLHNSKFGVFSRTRNDQYETSRLLVNIKTISKP